jgi:hypothetical protein
MDLARDASILIEPVGPIGDQAAAGDIETVGIDRWRSVRD